MAPFTGQTYRISSGWTRSTLSSEKLVVLRPRKIREGCSKESKHRQIDLTKHQHIDLTMTNQHDAHTETKTRHLRIEEPPFKWHELRKLLGRQSTANLFVI